MPAEFPKIILVEPQIGENIGAAARAMLNFGLMDLRLVNPRDGWPNEVAVRNGSGAFDVIVPEVFERFEDAIADLQMVYATTARPRDMVKDVCSPREVVEKMSGSVGFVFGRERTGLENDQIALCHEIVEIPTNPDFSSLNLAQAVLVIGYEWMRICGEARAIVSHEPASHGEVMNLITRLEDELEDKNFFREANLKPTMINNIRSALTRSSMTDQEVRTFHGIVSALIGNKVK
ncbi:RNA methyltransferase [Alphaproteobacteria bacterium]|nr:RNA methyltransferase [Alphaproteobacteria bacterium]